MLREFLYVDADKVRSILAQIDGGVTEEVSRTEKDVHRLAGGVKNVFDREKVWGAEESTQRSLADAIFPTLEDALTTGGYLCDVSDDLSELAADEFKAFQQRFAPGSFVRITGPTRLFDVHYLAKVFGGYASATVGAEILRNRKRQQAPPKGMRPAAKGRQSSATSTESDLESLIPDFVSSSGDLDAQLLRALIQVARGIFYPGLHVAMSPNSNSGLTITARLQQGRRFLDSEPEVLFARYGVMEQEWTLVGTIGSYSIDSHSGYSPGDVVSGTKIQRAAVLDTINGLLASLGDRGLIDQPQFPGFSLVPFALYRTILPVPQEAGSVALHGAVV